jgi:beta-mannosidase
MALNWCFNEPWPTAANNSIVNWPNIPKPGFYAVKNACRPYLASASLKKFKYTEGEEFSADIWVLNDLPDQTSGGKISVKLVAGTTELKLLDWEYANPDANTNLVGPTVRCKLPSWESDRFKLILEVAGNPEYNSEYTFLYSPKAVKTKKANVLNR